MSTTLKAISLWQPWASLWLSPCKLHETRHWETKHRGWLAVHAAKRPMTRYDTDDFEGMLRDNFGDDWKARLPFGAIIGRVFVTACLSTNDPANVPAVNTDDYWCGDFSADRFAWRRTEYRRLRQPIPFVGRQSIFSVPAWPESAEEAS